MKKTQFIVQVDHQLIFKVNVPAEDTNPEKTALQMARESEKHKDKVVLVSHETALEIAGEKK